MTAYEEFKYADDGQVTAVFPASPEAVWSDQVLQFSQALIREYKGFKGIEPDDSWDAGYFAGNEAAVEQIIELFSTIFHVTINKDAE